MKIIQTILVILTAILVSVLMPFAQLLVLVRDCWDNEIRWFPRHLCDAYRHCWSIVRRYLSEVRNGE